MMIAYRLGIAAIILCLAMILTPFTPKATDEEIKNMYERKKKAASMLIGLLITYVIVG